MKTINRTLIACAVASVLGGGAVIALAGDAKADRETARDGQYATVVNNGSIRIKDDNERTMAAKARITVGEAAQIAAEAYSGKVTESQLDEENGYLIWEVEVIDSQGQEAQVKIDAGDGRILAIESGEDDEHHEGNREDDDHEDRAKDKHSRWKFWEDNDRDERSGKQG